MRRVLITALLFFFVFTARAFGQETNWVIDTFTSDISIAPSGKVLIAETIDVTFPVPKHGIYRDIPYLYRKEDGKEYLTDVAVSQVLQDGKNAMQEVSYSNGYKRIKIGDPAVVISGTHEYVISYVVTGVLAPFEDHDELYWNVTSNNWPVPILQAQANVTLPVDGLLKIACYQGTVASTKQCQSKIVNEKQATFQASRPLSVGEGLTVVSGFKRGLVPILRITPPPTATEKLSNPTSGYIFFGFIIFSILFIFWLWWTRGRENGYQTVVAEFEAPEKLRPAEIGVLMDERADTLDVTATIVDLAVREFLTITEVPKKWLFGSIDYILEEKEKNKDSLLPYEKKLLSRIFEGGSKVKLSELKQAFYDDLVEIKVDLYKDVISKKIFPTNPENVRRIYLGIAIALTTIGFVFAIIGITSSELFFLALPSGGMFIGGFLLLILSQSMPRRTAQGKELLRRAKGFRLFLDTAEKYRQQFFEKENLFNELLPYAIVFGLTDKFAKTMKDLGLPITQTTTSWYQSTGSFRADTFGSRISGFSGSFSAAIVATTPSGSGFAHSSGFSSSNSSGGSSGGGFGGGGGGSW